MKSLNEDKEYQDLKNRRYHSYSDWNFLTEHNKRYAQLGIGLLILRELPIRNFYARAFVIGAFLQLMWIKQWKYFDTKNPPVYYMNDRDRKEFLNYPMLWQTISRKIQHRHRSPTMLESDHWWQYQSPVFYMHHFKHYRYVFRHRREIPWDGTYNQPIFPFMGCNDRTAFVSAGLLEATEPKGSANW